MFASDGRLPVEGVSNQEREDRVGKQVRCRAHSGTDGVAAQAFVKCEDGSRLRISIIDELPVSPDQRDAYFPFFERKWLQMTDNRPKAGLIAEQHGMRKSVGQAGPDDIVAVSEFQIPVVRALPRPLPPPAPFAERAAFAQRADAPAGAPPVPILGAQVAPPPVGAPPEVVPAASAVPAPVPGVDGDRARAPAGPPPPVVPVPGPEGHKRRRVAALAAASAPAAGEARSHSFNVNAPTV
jgi:hypothetical protein